MKTMNTMKGMMASKTMKTTKTMKAMKAMKAAKTMKAMKYMKAMKKPAAVAAKTKAKQAAVAAKTKAKPAAVAARPKKAMITEIMLVPGMSLGELIDEMTGTRDDHDYPQRLRDMRSTTLAQVIRERQPMYCAEL